MHALVFLLILPSALTPRSELLESVNQIAAPGSPGNVVVWSENGIPVAVDSAGRTVVGAADGPGRVVAFSHDGTLAAFNVADTGRMFVNSVRWAAWGQPSKVVCSLPALATYLKAQGVAAQTACEHRNLPEPPAAVLIQEMARVDMGRDKELLGQSPAAEGTFRFSFSGQQVLAQSRLLDAHGHHAALEKIALGEVERGRAGVDELVLLADHAAAQPLALQRECVQAHGGLV